MPQYNNCAGVCFATRVQYLFHFINRENTRAQIQKMRDT
uniref:Uncharacterized protein n=1 Tax=Arundo donax TaxID=35708 RepID=A0A0A9BDC5_ARUDO